jgi:hypothetical protein
MVRLCFAAEDSAFFGGDGKAVLDPAKVTGKIVVCDRGSNARVSKGFAVRRGGGVGMLLMNTTPNSLNPDWHELPAVHLRPPDG